MNTDGEAPLDKHIDEIILDAANRHPTLALAGKSIGRSAKTMSRRLEKMGARRDPFTRQWIRRKPTQLAPPPLGSPAATAPTSFQFPDFMSTETHHHQYRRK